MTKTIEAIYTHGVLEPVEALLLPERQRVELIVRPIDGTTLGNAAWPDPASSTEERDAALIDLFAEIDRMDLHLGSACPHATSSMNAVDTNVLLYACDKSDMRRHSIAKQIITQTQGGVLVWQVAAEFVAAARRLEVRGLTREIAWARLKNFLRVYRLVLPSPPILEHAQRLHAEQQL